MSLMRPRLAVLFGGSAAPATPPRSQLQTFLYERTSRQQQVGITLAFRSLGQ